jgi:hypothetical protein
MGRRAALFFAGALIAALVGLAYVALLAPWLYDPEVWRDGPRGAYDRAIAAISPHSPNPEAAFWTMAAPWPLASFALMALFGSSTANLLETAVGARRRAKKILLLRRFRKERDAFRLTRAFDMLAARGHSVVTLSDSFVWHNESKSLVLYTILQLAVSFFIFMPLAAIPFLLCAAAASVLVFGAGLLFLEIAPSLGLGEPSQWTMEPALTGLAIVGVAWVILIRLSFMLIPAQWQTLPWQLARKWGPGIATSLWRPHWRGDARRVWRGAASTGGIYCLVVKDEEWQQAVKALVESADVICFDTAQTTDNIETEKQFIRQRKGATTILFTPDASEQSRNFEVLEGPFKEPGWEGIGDITLSYPAQSFRPGEQFARLWKLKIQRSADAPLDPETDANIADLQSKDLENLPFRFGETLDRVVTRLI